MPILKKLAIFAAICAALACGLAAGTPGAMAQGDAPLVISPERGATAPQGSDYRAHDPYQGQPPRAHQSYSPQPGTAYSPPAGSTYSPPPAGSTYSPPPGHTYGPPPPQAEGPPPQGQDGTFTMDEITETGHRFFGRVSVGLARVIEYAFSKAGRPNGYILGEEAGGAFVAGLRYGEGKLYTKDAGEHKVYWQGPSIGYDFGAEGSKTMILVYNLRSIEDIFATYGGVDGSAYFIGGVGITFQTRDHVTLAPIRSGVGLRLGANVGYLKYTRRPTWNPF
ncbi:MAG: EipA family protein [Hyphomicrobiales bacterium]